jgi:tetratricopeptide (TPR) repeat protein
MTTPSLAWGLQMPRGWWLLGQLAAISVIACSPPGGPISEPAIVAARFDEIVSSLEVALPYAQDRDTFAAPAAQPAIRESLRVLRRNAAALELHGGDHTFTFAFFSRRLADGATQISERFESGRREPARLLLNELMGTCAGCHVRLPDAHEATRAAPASIRSLRPQVRARLLVAIYRFDAALEVYEASFLSREASASKLDFDGAIEAFLVVALRVRTDFARAARGLATLAARDDVPPYLARLIAIWLAALRDLTVYEHSSMLAEAREVMLQAGALRRHPTDRTALVHDLVASAILHRVVAQGLASHEETAEASYLLGLAELRSDPSPRLPQAEAYLESAIRAAPGSTIARDAYAALEERTILDWSGSDGAHVPVDVEKWLQELWRIAEGQRDDD